MQSVICRQKGQRLSVENKTELNEQSKEPEKLIAIHPNFRLSQPNGSTTKFRRAGSTAAKSSGTVGGRYQPGQSSSVQRQSATNIEQQSSVGSFHADPSSHSWIKRPTSGSAKVYGRPPGFGANDLRNADLAFQEMECRRMGSSERVPERAETTSANFSREWRADYWW